MLLPFYIIKDVNRNVTVYVKDDHIFKICIN